eukprot:scaffold1019_cov172-Amphora_coffeaeformis.AAC.15
MILLGNHVFQFADMPRHDEVGFPFQSLLRPEHEFSVRLVRDAHISDDNDGQDPNNNENSSHTTNITTTTK